MSVTAIQFATRSTSSGPAAYAIAASVNGGAVYLVSVNGTVSTTSVWALKGPSVFGTPVVGGSGQPVTIYIYMFNDGK